VTGNELPNRPSVAGTASETERNNAQDCHQERFAGGLPTVAKPSFSTASLASLAVSTISVGRY
jgi:hypothetical protein